MASIPQHVLKTAADLYRVRGNTWADVVAELRAQGRRHSRKHLQRKCRLLGLLGSDGRCVCVLCKAEFMPERAGGARFCEGCREASLPGLLSRRRKMRRGQYADGR